jgi:hypothetical protein
LNPIEQTYNKEKVYEDIAQGRMVRPTTAPIYEPSFFLLGAQKAGTTSLIQYLVAHPKIIAPKYKEIAYFSDATKYANGIDWYRAHFESKKQPILGKRKPIDGITGDASANHFESLEAPARLKQAYPDAKLIILLRNPVDRAFSQWKMASRYGFETLEFEGALMQEAERLDFGREHVLPTHGHDYVFQKLGYFTKGVYASFLKMWLHEFDRDQLLIIQSEKMYAEPEKVYGQVLDFLGLEAYDKVPFSLYNQGGTRRMKAEIRSKLTALYAKHNERLFELLGEKWDWS